MNMHVLSSLSLIYNNLRIHQRTRFGYIDDFDIFNVQGCVYICIRRNYLLAFKDIKLEMAVRKFSSNVLEYTQKM